VLYFGQMPPSYKSLLGKCMRLPLRLIPDGSIMPIMRGPLRGKCWITGSSVHGCWLGTFEPDKVRSISAEGKRLNGSQFLDIGANVGFYSLLAASFGARVIAFEPLPRNLNYLDRHVSMNGADVEVRACALSDTDGEARFDAQRDSSEGRLSVSGDIVVSVARLDSLDLQPNYMKIDVEGGEAKVLQGAAKTISKYLPMIFLATHGSEVEAQCLRMLREFGYRAVPLSPAEYALRVEAADKVAALG
jgi:FkbM family methyltransferase